METRTETVTKEKIEADGTRVVTVITTKTTRYSPNYDENVSKDFSSKLTLKNKKKEKEEEPEEASEEEDGGFDKFEKESLDRHNYYRAKHGCPPLKLDREICNYAQEWANRLANTGSFQHRSNNRYGENLFMKGGSNVTINGNEAVDSWYNEINQYNFSHGGFSMGTGHFTQVVWRSSQRLGIAYAKRGSSIYVVANYDPPGNFQGRFQENVPPPKR